MRSSTSPDPKRTAAAGRRPRVRSGPFLCVAALLAASFVLPAAGQGRAGQSRSDYRIEARLDGETKTLQGELWLTWTNGSGEAVSDLWFHLYLNAFSNNRSTHLHEARGELRGGPIDEDWGWSQVTAVEVAGAGDGGGYLDVFPSFRYRRPDDGRQDDRTVFSVELPRPVEPGSQLTVHLRWESQLPRVRRRTGYKDEFLLVAQWFPKLGVYEAGRGWNCHQFHKNTEFYSDYGVYDVTLDLPLEYAGRTWASGVKVSEEALADRLRVHFEAPGPRDRDRPDAFGKERLVHDFTWTADTRYVADLKLIRRTFRFADWAERFPDEIARARQALGPDVDLKMRNVDITVLIHPERLSQLHRHFRATEAALFFYGLWFGEYPYEHITVVDPAWGARGAGGMEYPTLFTCGTRLLTTEDMQIPEGVTVHECGHQFWYGLVGNNEFEAAWLDEGFNSYTDSEVLWRVYGPQRGTTDYAGIPMDGARVAGLAGGGAGADALTAKRITIPLPFLPDPELEPLPGSGFLDLWRDQPQLTFAPEWTDPRWNDRVRYLRDPSTDPIETHGWKYADSRSYSTNSYPRTAVALRSLPAAIALESGGDGYGAFLRGMRHYARTWRYAHPYPDDFYASFQEGAGVDAAWYFRQLFQDTATVDWSVSVEQERRASPKGFFQSEGGRFFERPADEEEPEEGPWEVIVTVRRTGEILLPLPLRLTFEDGTVRDLVWTRAEQGERTWMRLELESEQKLVSAEIDPQRGYYLDADLSNNRWYDERDSVSAWRWGERVQAQIQRYLHWIGGFGG